MPIRIPPKTNQDAIDSTEALQAAADGGGGGGPVQASAVAVVPPISGFEDATTVQDVLVGIGVLTGENTSTLSDLSDTIDHFTTTLATTSKLGAVKAIANVEDSVATDVAGLVADFNALLAKMRTSGVLATQQ
jgi:hypothetical protein